MTCPGLEEEACKIRMEGIVDEMVRDTRMKIWQNKQTRDSSRKTFIALVPLTRDRSHDRTWVVLASLHKPTQGIMLLGWAMTLSYDAEHALHVIATPFPMPIPN